MRSLEKFEGGELSNEEMINTRGGGFIKSLLEALEIANKAVKSTLKEEEGVTPKDKVKTPKVPKGSLKLPEKTYEKLGGIKVVKNISINISDKTILFPYVHIWNGRKKNEKEIHIYEPFEFSVFVNSEDRMIVECERNEFNNIDIKSIALEVIKNILSIKPKENKKKKKETKYKEEELPNNLFSVLESFFIDIKVVDLKIKGGGFLKVYFDKRKKEFRVLLLKELLISVSETQKFEYTNTKTILNSLYKLAISGPQNLEKDLYEIFKDEFDLEEVK